jgi:hypothetical protein
VDHYGHNGRCHTSEPVDEDILDSERDAGAEYEQTKLRKVSTTEMKKLASDWIAKMRASTLKTDFETAAYNCNTS